MIETLSIEGFRGFEALEIGGLGRVNLLVGRNAVGKTSVLEAISVLAEGMNAPLRFKQLLADRGETGTSYGPRSARRLDWARLFRDERENDPAWLRIRVSGDLDRELVAKVMFGRRVPDDTGGFSWSFSREQTTSHVPILHVTADGVRVIPFMDLLLGSLDLPPEPAWFPHVALPASGLTNDSAAAMLDRLTLSGYGDAVVAAVNLVVPGIERIAFITLKTPGSERESHREPFVHRRNRTHPEPLRSLGDGAVRLLEISLTLLDAAGGLMLVDEIENGLHYAVQPDLWRTIFQLAVRHDVQVFAATHSWDCIEAFQQAAAAHPAQGALVRIDRDEGGHYATVYSEDELAIATKKSIEVR